VAVGPVYRFNRDLLIIPEHTIEPNQIDAELESLKTALQKATTELEEIRTLLEHHLDQEHARMIEAQIMALTDIELLKIIENDVRMNHRNVVQAYWEAMNLYENLLKESTYVYQQQRLCDLQDVKRRVIHHLQIEEAYALLNWVRRPFLSANGSRHRTLSTSTIKAPWDHNPSGWA